MKKKNNFDYEKYGLDIRDNLLMDDSEIDPEKAEIFIRSALKVAAEYKIPVSCFTIAGDAVHIRYNDGNGKSHEKTISLEEPQALGKFYRENKEFSGYLLAEEREGKIFFIAGNAKTEKSADPMSEVIKTYCKMKKQIPSLHMESFEEAYLTVARMKIFGSMALIALCIFIFSADLNEQYSLLAKIIWVLLSVSFYAAAGNFSFLRLLSEKNEKKFFKNVQ